MSPHAARNVGETKAVPVAGEPAASHFPLEADSRAWVRALRSEGPEREYALARLHDLLRRAARFEVSRRRASVSMRGEALEDLAMQAADDALVAVLAKLDDFRGASRFTTWAYKFALLEAGVRMRRRAWQEREVVLDPKGWRRFADATESPHVAAESHELLAAACDCIAEGLTAHQRQVLIALAIDGVPIDVLAERLTTTRGALYKTLHDARCRLRARLAERGLNGELVRLATPRASRSTSRQAPRR